MQTIGISCDFEGSDGVGGTAGKKFSLMENEKRLLEESNEELMRKYDNQKDGGGKEGGEDGKKKS